MASKLVRGSFLILVGNLVFRVGGYVYRFLMATLLGPSSYGILGLTLPLQGIFQVLSAGGLPPAIAKYVAEYNALDEHALAKQSIFTSLKIMIFLGLLFGLLMVFFVAPWLAFDVFNKPLALYPLQAVGLITPFSVIVGAFRGAFQGVYKMEYILASRTFEQIGMILFATAFVIIGLSALGAVLGSVLGFVLSAVVSLILFKKYMWKYIPQPEENEKFSIADELKLAKKLIFFSVPVTVTALAEMGIYSICTFIMGMFITSSEIGHFTAADPIARLPLVISISVATTILPASSEAFALKSQELLDKYVSMSYKYSMLLIIPMCIGIAMFSKPIMELVYFLRPEYVLGAGALAILVLGMSFYSLFAISASIIQGIGNPKIPMYVLIFGAVVTFVLGWFLIPLFGIEGGALATTIASFLIMVPILGFTFHLTKTTPPYKFLGKLIVAAIIMAVFIYLIPSTILGLVIGIILCPILYITILILIKAFDKSDFEYIRNFSTKFGLISKLVNKIVDMAEKRY
ncbi:flippase [Methanobrevibacter filiformis]|uniref:Putative cell division protein YtgP n=1 Tax=Methanobrevibacter filiformis TaxID=55758 RepID=A0A166AY90_9EURY|nr:flippase [Methanobrevibacter filiformis]KZX12624.1 putative cell division protein YtgP [Methanobrevibacter filiformis]